MNADLATELLGRTVRIPMLGNERWSGASVTSADPFEIRFAGTVAPGSDCVRFSQEGRWHAFRPVNAADSEGWTFRVGTVEVARLSPHVLNVLAPQSEDIWRKVVVPILAWVGGHDPQIPTLSGDVLTVEDRLMEFINQQRTRSIERVRNSIAADEEHIEAQVSSLRALRREVEEGDSTLCRLKAGIDDRKVHIARLEAVDGASLTANVRAGLREDMSRRFGVIQSVELEYVPRHERVDIVAQTCAFRLATSGTGFDNPFNPSTKAPEHGGDAELGPFTIRLKWVDGTRWSAEISGETYDVREDYIHPHLNGSSICFGSVGDDADTAQRDPDPLTYLSVLDALLTSYNPQDPYRSLIYWVGCGCSCNDYCDRCEGWACECDCWTCGSCGERSDSYETPCDHCEYCTGGCCECVRCDSCCEVADEICADECRCRECCDCDRCSSCKELIGDAEQCSECSHGFGCCGHADDCDHHPDNTCSNCENIIDSEQCFECSRGLECCGHADDCDNHPDNTDGE